MWGGGVGRWDWLVCICKLCLQEVLLLLKVTGPGKGSLPLVSKAPDARESRIQKI